MAITRAEKKASGGSKYMGFCEATLVEVKDRISETTDDGSKKFPWADLYLEVTIQTKDSEYTRNMQICGSFDKDDSGKVKADSATLKRLYWFLDAVGCQAGINADGGWEDEKGEPISDVVGLLNKYTIDSTNGYYVYIYKEPDKKNPTKSWTRVHNKIVKNDTKGRADLESYINYMKTKGYLKEATDAIANGVSDAKVVDSFSELDDMFSDDGMPA